MTTEAADPEAILPALDAMPVFPLTDAVLFPGTFLPLHIFEPRYRALVRDCLATHKVFAVAQVTDESQLDAHGNPAIAEVAGAGLIVEHHALPDGRSTLLLHGHARVRLDELPFVEPYRRARATVLHDLPLDVATWDRTALLASAAAFSAELEKQDRRFSFRLPPHLSPGGMADHCAQHLVIDPSVRQALLGERNPRERVRLVLAELAMQHAALLHETGGVLH